MHDQYQAQFRDLPVDRQEPLFIDGELLVKRVKLDSLVPFGSDLFYPCKAFRVSWMKGGEGNDPVGPDLVAKGKDGGKLRGICGNEADNAFFYLRPVHGGSEASKCPVQRRLDVAFFFKRRNSACCQRIRENMGMEIDMFHSGSSSRTPSSTFRSILNLLRKLNPRRPSPGWSGRSITSAGTSSTAQP